jgi:hypothetical protein
MDVLSTKQNRVIDKELDLIARQDDQKVKYKNLTEYIELEGIQEQCRRTWTKTQKIRCRDWWWLQPGLQYILAPRKLLKLHLGTEEVSKEASQNFYISKLISQASSNKEASQETSPRLYQFPQTSRKFYKLLEVSRRFLNTLTKYILDKLSCIGCVKIFNPSSVLVSHILYIVDDHAYNLKILSTLDL